MPIRVDGLPTQFGSYLIHACLGVGGMSVVYLAEQSNPRRLVALKVLRGRDITREFMQREVETLALLKHPGIAQIYEAGIASTPDGPKPFFAMEFVSSTPDMQFEQGRDEEVDDEDGCEAQGRRRAVAKGATGLTLLEYASTRPTWTLPDRLEIMARVCDAIDYAHKRGVIHRDLKPANILIDHLGQPKVIDFGIAMLTGAARGDARDAAAFAGTLPYMSPEQLSGDAGKIDLRSDVYAIGVATYQIICGSLPIDKPNGDTNQDSRMPRERKPTPLSDHGPKVPPDVEAVVFKAIAKAPEQRYQTAADLASDIRRSLAKKPVSARRNTPAYRAHCLLRRRPFITSASAIALILIGAATFSAYRQNAGARDALALLLTGLEQADPISSDGTPATLDKLVATISEDLEQLTTLHPEFAGRIHLVLGSWLMRNGSGGAEAIHHYERAADFLKEQRGAFDPYALGAINNYGMALSQSGRAAEAIPLFKDLISLGERADDPNGVLVTRGNLAVALLRVGEFLAALEQFAIVETGFVAADNKYEALKARVWQGRVLTKAGFLTEAEALQRRALEISEGEKPLFSDLSLAIMDELTYNLILLEHWQEAMVELMRMDEMLKLYTAPDHAWNRAVLGRMRRVQSELGDVIASDATQRAIEVWEARYGSQD